MTMTAQKMINYFSLLTPKTIREQRPGYWGDADMVDVPVHFEEAEDEERELAAIELMLHSPELSDDVDYHYFYEAIHERLYERQEYIAAIRWLHAGILYTEQHENGQARGKFCHYLVHNYLHTGNFDVGVGISTRTQLSTPATAWDLFLLGINLAEVGLTTLAVEVAERCQSLAEAQESEEQPGGFTPEEYHGEILSIVEEYKSEQPNQFDRTDEVRPDIVQAFREVLYTDNTPKQEGYTAPLDQLVTATDDAYQTFAADLLQPKPVMGWVFAPELIRMACDDALVDGPAVGRALDILCQLQADNAAMTTEIAAWIEKADVHWKTTLHSPFIGKVAGFTNDELVGMAQEKEYDVVLRLNAAKALMERMKHDLAPADQVMPLLRMLLTNPETRTPVAEDELTGFLIGAILDYGLKELYPEMEAAFVEDRVAPDIISLDYVQEEFDMPLTETEPRQEDGLYLLLECKVCERQREHFVQYITHDLGTPEREEEGNFSKYGPYIMDREIVCPKCGTVDLYEVSPMSLFKITGRNAEDNPRLQEIECAAMYQSMNPMDAIEKYREMIAEEPELAYNYRRMGSVFRILHRGRDAVEAYRIAYDLEPDSGEGVIFHAMVEHDFGSRRRALELYNQALSMYDKGVLSRVMPSLEARMVTQIARRGIRKLKKREPSPFSIEEFVLREEDGKILPPGPPDEKKKSKTEDGSSDSTPKKRKKRKKRR
ncbi:MAG: hypothetical protein AAF639_15650 [Chloroflexota bacterium]